mmetsp:Transcript_112153/g.312160  ORF Transcript_112153/g.312160 Transcript_112153/m.312160 type:complete len:254 (-) Transcript_112153:697-1458(-)
MALAVLLRFLPRQHITTADEGRLSSAALRTLAHVAPISKLRVALPRSAAMQGDRRDAPVFQLRHELVRIAAAKVRRLLVLVISGAHLQRQSLGPQGGRHAPHDALHGLRPRHQPRTGSALVHLVQGAAAVDVDEIAVHLLVDKLRQLGHHLHVAPSHLHSEALLAGMATQQSELPSATLKDGRRERHLAHCHLTAELDTQAPEGQIPHRGEWSQDALPTQVQGPPLRCDDAAEGLLAAAAAVPLPGLGDFQTT